MLTQEDLQAISMLIKSEVEPIKTEMSHINERLDGIDGRLDGIDERLDNIEQTMEEMKEDAAITRDVTNSIGEWIDYYFADEKPYPLDKDRIDTQSKALRFIND